MLVLVVVVVIVLLTSSSSMPPRWAASRGPCAACKHLRRKCPPDCIFSPYFPPSDTQSFSLVHRIFGSSNASKILKKVPEHLRQATADSLVFEAKERSENLVYGLCERLANLKQRVEQLERLNQHLLQQIQRQQMHHLQNPYISHPPQHHTQSNAASSSNITQQQQQYRPVKRKFPQRHTYQQHHQNSFQRMHPYMSYDVGSSREMAHQQQQYPTATSYLLPAVTTAIAPGDNPQPATDLETGFGQQPEQNNNSGYLADLVQMFPRTPNVPESSSRQQLEQNNSSGYLVDKVQTCSQPATDPASSSRQQLERNNSSGYLVDKVLASFNSPGTRIEAASLRQQLEQNNSSHDGSYDIFGTQFESASMRQQLEQNNSSGYLVDGVQLCSQPATVLETSSRQQLEQNNSLGYLADNVTGQQLEQNNSSGYLFDKGA